MSSKATDARSIATQLVWLFTPASVLLLSLGLGLLYWLVTRHAFEEDNAVLADKLAAIRTDLVEAGNPSVLAQELQVSHSKQPLSFYVRVVRADGTIAAESRGMNQLLPPDLFATAAPAFKPREIRAGAKWLALGSTTAESGGEHFTIQVAQDRTADERFEKQFGILTIAILAAGAILSALIARTIARRGLRPLRDMTRAMKRINSTQLSDRVTTRGWPRELQPLGDSFDAMLERLETSFTRLSQFSADLAHELRTPLSNMLGEAQVALTRRRTADEYRAVVESQVDECERLARTIDNLLFLARAEGAERQVHRERLDARAAIEKLANYYSALAEERQVTITCSGRGEIQADPVLFERALINLLDNAVRFTAAGGNIAISAQPEGDATCVIVTDTGTGIPAEHLPHIFDRFYRVDASRSSAGTGLGLSLVRSIAELHDGSVSIASEPGKGTSVRLNFPSRKNITEP
ncbi:MAG: heavy metal sensor histidine kinase [Chthoniobacterales bacterium]